MSQSSPDRSPPYHRLWGVGLGLGVAYWILESAIDTYIFSEGPFYDRLVRPDPNEAWMRVLVFLLLVVFGGYAQRCLSQRRVAASELDQSEERFAKVFHRGPVAVVVSRLEDGVCVDVNDAFLRMCGYRRDEVVGRSFLELNTWVNPDDRVAVIRRLRREGSIRGMETSFRSKSGDLRIGRFSAERIKIGNAPCMIAIAEDVTDRNRAAEALRLSEDRYRNLAEAATDAIITIDDSSTIIYANPAASALFGYPPGGLLNEPLTKLIPPALRGNHEAGLRRYLETGKRKLFWDRSEFQGRHQDGSEIPLEISFGEQWQGNRRTFTAIVRDITERKKAEAALRESEERLRLTLDAVSGGGWDWNIATGEVYFSDSWIASLGYRREEVQPHVSFWNSILHPDDMPRVMEVLNAHFEGRTDCYECEIRQRTRSGAYRWNLDRGMVVSRDTDGKPLRMVGTDTDITVRKQAEEVLHRTYDELEERVKLRTAELLEANQRLERENTERKLAEERIRRQALVFDNMFDAVLLTDMDHRIIGLNPAAERMFGYTKEGLIGQKPEILNRAEEAETLTRTIRKAVSEIGRWAGMITFVRADGTEGVCEASLMPLRDEQGNQVGIVSVNRDITARHKAEEGKAELERQLRRSQNMEAVGTFVSGITHDFDNLLTAIFAYTDLAKKTLPDDHPAARNLEKVEQAARQARDVTNALLTFSHRTVLEKSPVNLSQTLEDSIRLLGPLLPSRIRIVADLDRDSDLWIHADAGQVPQILMNLANNARDAMPDGGHIRVTLRDAESTSGRSNRRKSPVSDRGAVITVEDSGCGMPEEIQSRVFEPFFTTKPRGKGTGLGLSLVLGIVQDLGGDIDLTSETGKGTCVKLWLPCCDPPEEVQEDINIGRAHRFRGESILVVEASRHIRSIMISALRSRGYDVISAANLHEAIAVIRRREGSVLMLIIDLDTLDETAPAQVREIQSSRDNMPLVCLAGTLSIDIDQYGLGGGHLLRKPFQISEFTSTVSRVLSLACE